MTATWADCFDRAVEYDVTLEDLRAATNSSSTVGGDDG